MLVALPRTSFSATASMITSWGSGPVAACSCASSAPSLFFWPALLVLTKLPSCGKSRLITRHSGYTAQKRRAYCNCWLQFCLLDFILVINVCQFMSMWRGGILTTLLQFLHRASRFHVSADANMFTVHCSIPPTNVQACAHLVALFAKHGAHVFCSLWPHPISISQPCSCKAVVCHL